MAHFFRRCFDLLRPGGSLGLIATNTIAQGDTRSTGLRWICLNGGTIYAARKRYKWPGVAAVVVSVVHLLKESFATGLFLDKIKVSSISAFLLEGTAHEDPYRLKSNSGLSFVGSYVLGAGFIFDDEDASSDESAPCVPSPLSTMRRLAKSDLETHEIIKPYIGGEDINNSPTQTSGRYVIDFGTRSDSECIRDYPEIFYFLKSKAEHCRASHSTAPWWQYERTRPELYRAISEKKYVLFHSFTSKFVQFAMIPNKYIYAMPHVVIAMEEFTALSCLQSSVHDLWARFAGSTMGDGLRYAPQDCFETFPFPRGINIELKSSHDDLGVIGKLYESFRAELMVANNEGLTCTYNRFHDPSETSSELMELRRLHGKMDEAVLNAYGWIDVSTSCGFGLDYLDTEEDAQLPEELQERIDGGELFFWDANDALDFQCQLETYGAISGRRKLPWRYRWPDAVSDDVLARLLALNAERYAEEVAQGLHGKVGKKAPKTTEKSKRKAAAVGESKLTNEPYQPGLQLF